MLVEMYGVTKTGQRRRAGRVRRNSDDTGETKEVNWNQEIKFFENQMVPVWASTKVAAQIFGIAPNALRIRKCRGEIECRYFGKHLRFNVSQLLFRETRREQLRAIKKVVTDGKTKYEVIVKIRDKSGKQIKRKKRWFSNEREARKVELDKWFNPVWSDKFVDEIKPSDVHKVVFEDSAAVSSYMKRGLLKIVKRIFNIAIEEGLMIRNPAVGIRVRCADANQAVFNKNEVEILLKEAKRTDHRFFSHWTLALLTAMRSGEQAKVLKNFGEEIGITPIKFHDLRATFITQVLNNGVALSKVMAIVGHFSL